MLYFYVYYRIIRFDMVKNQTTNVLFFHLFMHLLYMTEGWCQIKDYIELGAYKTHV